MMLTPYTHHAGAAPLAGARPAGCPVDLSHPVVHGAAEDSESPMCGLVPSAWELSFMQPVHASTGSRVKNALRWAAGAQGCGQPHADAELRTRHSAPSLHARGELAKNALKPYAQAFLDAGTKAQPSWIARMAQGKADVFLSGPAYFSPVVTQSHDDAALAQGCVVPLPQRNGLVIDSERFFTVGHSGAVLVSQSGKRHLQALFVHERCSEMLAPLARVLDLSLEAVERWVDRQIAGACETDREKWAKVVAALREGDEAGVVKAFVGKAVIGALHTSPIMPRETASPGAATCTAACEELLNVVGDILTFEPPRLARSQQVRRLLGANALRIARDGFIQAKGPQLRMMMAAYSTAMANAAIRTRLQAVTGGFDLLAAQEVRLRFVESEASLAAMHPARSNVSASMTMAEGPIDLGTQAAQSYLTAERTAAAPCIRSPSITLHFALDKPGEGGLDYLDVVHELLHGYHDGGVVGASRAISAAIGIQTREYEGDFAFEHVVEYVQHKILPMPAGQLAIRPLAVQLMLQAQAQLEGRDYEPCESALLALIFDPRQAWGHAELAQLERHVRCLHAQYQVDFAALGASNRLGVQLLVGAGGQGQAGSEVAMAGRRGDRFLVRALAPLPSPLPAGVEPASGGMYLVKAEKLVSRVVAH